MLYLLSPAKSLDYDTPTKKAVLRKATLPQFLSNTAELIELLRVKTPAQVADLMGISSDLARLNVDRYAAWSADFTPANSKPAVFAFDGDVYRGLQAPTMSPADLGWAQRHLVILSGLYGALRPLDLLQAYRLEMGTSLGNPTGKDLYAYWGDALARWLDERLAGERSPVVVNLASQEYFRAVDRQTLQTRVVECVFEDWRIDRYKIIGLHAKRARGLMARHAILRRVASPSGLKSFDAEGYRFDAAVSTPDRLVFRRRRGG